MAVLYRSWVFRVASIFFRFSRDSKKCWIIELASWSLLLIASWFSNELSSLEFGMCCQGCSKSSGNASVMEGKKVRRAVLCPPRRAPRARPTSQDRRIT
jgi:hypothetical protein